MHICVRVSDVCGHMSHGMLEESEVSFWESVPSLHLCTGSRDQTWHQPSVVSTCSC